MLQNETGYLWSSCNIYTDIGTMFNRYQGKCTLTYCISTFICEGLILVVLAVLVGNIEWNHMSKFPSVNYLYVMYLFLLVHCSDPEFPSRGNSVLWVVGKTVCLAASTIHNVSQVPSFSFTLHDILWWVAKCWVKVSLKMLYHFSHFSYSYYLLFIVTYWQKNPMRN